MVIKPVDSMNKQWMLVWMLFSQLLLAQLPANLSPQARISLLTIAPGDELYSTFGHSAIRIVDPPHKLDRIYNYGTFSFQEPWFYLKFARGQLDYQLSAYAYIYAEMDYRNARRSVVEQVLHLTPQMTNDIYHFLEINYLPENRRYRYDFFFDNCATRIRDVFEKVLGDSLRWFLHPTRRLTFRQYLDIYLVSHPFSDFGIDLGMGARADRIATPREAMFLPDFLYESFDRATIRIDGQDLPLVTRRDTLLRYDVPHRMQKAPPWPAIIFWAVLLLILIVTFAEWQQVKAASVALRVLDGFIFGVIGLLGVVIALLWFATDHKVTPDNWNLIWALPTHIVIAFLIVLRKKPRWLSIYWLASSIIAGIFLISWQWIPQQLHPAIIPLILTIGFRSGWRYWQQRSG